MKRRQFLQTGASALTFPIGIAKAQTQGRIPLVGELLTRHSVGGGQIGMFEKRLAELGWIAGSTVRFERRVIDLVGGDIRGSAQELVALNPTVLLSVSTILTTALAQQTKQIPIVFEFVGDAIEVGFTDSFARPSLNLTGFTGAEWDIGGKMVQFLRDVKPDLRRVVVLANPDVSGGRSVVAKLIARTQELVSSSGVECVLRDVHSTEEIEAAIASLGPSDGFWAGTDQLIYSNRALIIDLAARYKVAAIYSWSPFVSEGGLMSYSVDVPILWSAGADYVDRILRGATVSELPIQNPKIYNLDLNLATAKALGLAIPRTMLEIARQIVE